MANTAPTLTGFNTSDTFTEASVSTTPQFLDTSVVFSDPDNNFNGGHLTISGALAEDVISVFNQGTGAGQIGVSGNVISYGGVAIGTFAGGGNGSTFDVTFNGGASSSAIDALIQNLTFADASATPTASRNLILDVTDAAGAHIPSNQPASEMPLASGAFPLSGVDAGSYTSPVFFDVDGDGDLDALVGNYDSASIRFYRNTGGSYTEVTGGANPFNGVNIPNPTLATVDLDGDGDLDLVVGTDDGNTASVRSFRNNGGGSFTELTGGANPFNGFHFADSHGHTDTYGAPTFGDIDGDGLADAVFGTQSGRLYVFHQNADHSFTNITDLASNPLSNQSSPSDTAHVVPTGGDYQNASPLLIDFDGDGDQDLVLFHGNSGDPAHNTPLVFRQNADHSFTNITATSANPFSGFTDPATPDPEAVDFDGDGDLDIIYGEGDGVFHAIVNTTPHGETITVKIANPVISGLDSSFTVTENASATVIDGNVSVSDSGGGFANASVVVSGLIGGEDVVAIRNQGNGATQIGVSGNTISYGGVAIGTFSGGNGANLSITLNGAATATSLSALLENLTYADTSDDPAASRLLSILVTESSGASVTGTITANVTPVNDAPTLTATGLNPGYTEGDAATQLFSGAAASAVESGQGFTALKLTVGNVAAGDTLTIDGVAVGLNDGALFNGGTYPGSIAVSIVGGIATVTLSLSSPIDAGALDGLIAGLGFSSSSDDPGSASRTVTITSVTDSGGTANGGHDTTALSLTSTVSVTPVDDAPVAVADAPGVSASGATVIDVTANDTDVDGGAKMVASIDGTLVSAGDHVTLASGATVTLNANGTLSYDANGAFDYLVSAQTAAATGATDSSASDSFTYTLNGGSGTTVSVTVNGVDGPGDELRGSAGNDKITSTAGDDTIVGEGGYDIVFYTNATSGVTVDLSDTSAQNTGGAGTDTLVDISGLTGSAFNDALVGDYRNNYLRGGAGNDNLTGGGGFDTSDNVGGDILDGGGGFDRAIYTDAEAGVTVDLNLTGYQQTGGAGNDELINIEALLGSDFGDTLIGDGKNNELKGAGGDDLLIGNGGNDQLNGGSGFDTADYSGAGVGVHVDLSVTVAQNTQVGSDTLTSIEALRGSVYNDILTGNSVVNDLRGGAGADKLDGGLGSDTLSGGTGADRFFFTTTLGANNIDTITDFTVGEDRVYLDHNVFAGLATGTLKNSAFVTGAAATGAGAQIIYNSASGALMFDSDGTGNGAAVQFATLSTGLSLTASSFSIV